jgi:hypothetical protein
LLAKETLFYLFGATKLHLDGLSKELTMHLKMNSSSLTLLAGSHPTVTDVALILKGYNEPNAHCDACHTAYNNRIPFNNWQVVKDNQTLTVSTQYTVNLSGLSKLVMGLFFMLCSGPDTGFTQGTYHAVSFYYIQMASGESLTGHYVKLHENSRLEYAELFDNLFGNNKIWYFIPFSSHLAEE